MHVSTMIRTATVGLAIATIAACSDTPSAPQQAQRQFLPATGFFADRGGNPHDAGADARKNADANAPVDSTAFDVDATRDNVLRFGQSYVAIPKNAICDQNSSYGIGTWDKPCKAYKGKLTISVAWSFRGGHTYAEFEPAMRFAPTQTVFLALYDKSAPKSKNIAMLWRIPDGGWINEALTDPSLGAASVSNFLVVRRIKHFSGYNISAGGCDPTVDPSCGSGGF